MIFKGYERIDAPDVYDGLDSTSTEMALSARQGNILNEKINNALLAAHPVGSIEINITGTNPSEYLGGEWESFGSGRTLVGVNTSDTSFNTVEKTGGEKNHTLTVDEMPEHKHGERGYYSTNIGVTTGSHAHVRSRTPISSDPVDGSMENAGGGQPHNNLQPYITVYFWKRIS